MIVDRIVEYQKRLVQENNKKHEPEPPSNIYHLNTCEITRRMRIVRNKWEAGDYTVKNEHLKHYEFIVDGERHVLGIVTISEIIDDLKHGRN